MEFYLKPIEILTKTLGREGWGQSQCYMVLKWIQGRKWRTWLSIEPNSQEVGICFLNLSDIRANCPVFQKLEYFSQLRWSWFGLFGTDCISLSITFCLSWILPTNLPMSSLTESALFYSSYFHHSTQFSLVLVEGMRLINQWKTKQNNKCQWINFPRTDLFSVLSKKTQSAIGSLTFTYYHGKWGTDKV